MAPTLRHPRSQWTRQEAGVQKMPLLLSSHTTPAASQPRQCPESFPGIQLALHQAGHGALTGIPNFRSQCQVSP